MQMVDGKTEETTTLNYEETPYADETYTIVGPPPGSDEFMPMPIDIIHTGHVAQDMMFDNFGGSVTGNNTSLWHLPAGIRYESQETKKNEEELRVEEEHLVEDKIAAAHAAGLEEGKAVGLQQAEEMIRQRTEEMNAKVGTIIKDMAAQVRERLKQIEQESIKLTVAIVDKIIPHAVDINPEYIVPILREALDLAGASIIKKVRVSPPDMEFITVVGLQKNLAEADGSWDFAADDTIRAGCVIETSAGEVEYDLDKAWARTKDNILKVR